ncbi:MAG: hypothetical protein IPM13_15175 [Phycisphaerales bacterium]|nr:hypothetical protein [Phycisphaerales bacterium]
MSISSINLARVSFNQRANALRDALQRNQAGLYAVQGELTTNLKFTRPSGDPVGARAATRFHRALEQLDTVRGSLDHVNGLLTEAEAAAQEAVDLLKEARTLALSAVGDSMSADERQAIATVVKSLLEQMVTVGNRRYQDTYLFSGHDSRPPFELAMGGVLYGGDGSRRAAIVDSDGSVAAFTIPGATFFAGASTQVAGVVDLDPALTSATLLSDLAGASGQGVRPGRITVRVGDERTTIDLRSAATVGDLVDRFNAELPGGLQAEMTTTGIRIVGGGGRTVTITDVPGHSLALDLGLRGESTDDTRPGADLQPRVTRLTQLSALNGGAGIDLAGGLRIRTGETVVTVGFEGVQTVEDVLTRINGAGVGAWARIAPDGRSIEVVSRVSGVDFAIEEAGGLAATRLGIRSLHGGTLLASLNGGRGVQTVSGADLRITARSGAAFDIDVDGVSTLQDLIDRINLATGGAVVADLTSSGNGIRLTDQTAGAGALSVSPLNSSTALTGLGLDVTASGGQLVGRDVNVQRVDSPFTGLIELHRALDGDDRLGISRAAERIERVLERLQEQQGQMAAIARTMSERSERVESETTATQVLLSDVRDTDFTDAAVRFQQLQVALQASLATAQKVMNLSLLDYLR